MDAEFSSRSACDTVSIVTEIIGDILSRLEVDIIALDSA
jgi:hypothetical protein